MLANFYGDINGNVVHWAGWAASRRGLSHLSILSQFLTLDWAREAVRQWGTTNQLLINTSIIVISFLILLQLLEATTLNCLRKWRKNTDESPPTSYYYRVWSGVYQSSRSLSACTCSWSRVSGCAWCDPRSWSGQECHLCSSWRQSSRNYHRFPPYCCQFCSRIPRFFCS